MIKRTNSFELDERNEQDNPGNQRIVASTNPNASNYSLTKIKMSRSPRLSINIKQIPMTASWSLVNMLIVSTTSITVLLTRDPSK